MEPEYRLVEIKESNGMGVAGFVLSLCALVLCWVPYLNWLLLILGIVFSIIGVTRRPKGLAIAGLCISGVIVLVYVIILIAAGAFFTALMY